MDSPEVRSKQVSPEVTYRHMLPRTVCHGVVVLTLGMTVSMRGPSFIDLQLISGTDVEKGSFYFTACAFGYVVGALLMGVLYSRVKAKDMLIMVSMVTSALIFAGIPWCSDFASMLIIHAAVAFFWALQETTANTEEVKRWEGNSYSAMQFLSFCYSLGGIIGPLIVEPFLAPKSVLLVSNISTDLNETSFPILFTQSSSTSYNVSHDLYPGANMSHHEYAAANLSHDQHPTNNLFTNILTPDPWNKTVNILNNVVDKSQLVKSTNASLDTTPSQTLIIQQSSIHYAYFIAGAIILMSSLPMCVLHIQTRKISVKKAPVDAHKEELHRKLPTKMYYVLTGMISLFYFFYTTVDDPYSMYLSVFVVSYLDWTKENGALVSSLYWSCSTVTKLGLVVLVRHVNPSLLLFFSCLGMVVVMITLTISSYLHIHFMVWVCTAFMAMSQSAVFGGGFAWADANLLKFDGIVTSCAMIFASLGAMLDPMLLGVTMKEFSPMAFPILLSLQTAITFIIFIAMLLVFKPYVSRKFGSPRSKHLNKLIVEEDSINFHEILKDENISHKIVCA